MLDKGQHLPDLSQSFRVVNYNFTEGKLYHVRVEYSNISYNPPDFDGVTLFAFAGGGTTGTAPSVKWRSSPQMSAYIVEAPGVSAVYPNQEVPITLRWYTNEDEDTRIGTDGSSTNVKDTIDYHWSSSGGGTFSGPTLTSNPDGTVNAQFIWKAPDKLPQGAGGQTSEGWVVLSLAVDDKGIVPAGETGSRKDGQLKASTLLQVTTPRTWTPTRTDPASGQTEGKI